MAVSRLLYARPALHFHTTRRGIPRSTRWYSSSSSDSGTDKSSCVKRATVAEEDRKEYTEMRPKISPKDAEVWSKVGGSWTSLKGIFDNLKQKILGNPHTVDSRASEVMQTQPGPHSSDSKESKCLTQASEDPTDSRSRTDSLSNHIPSDLQGDNPSDDLTDLTVSGFVKGNKCPSCTELSRPEVQTTENLKDIVCNEIKNAVQASEATLVSHSNKKNTGADANVIRRDLSQEILQSEQTSDDSKVGKRVLGTRTESERNHKMHAEHLSCALDHFLNEGSGTMQIWTANELGSVGNGRHQREKETASLIRPSNNGSKADGMPSSSNGSILVGGLADIFKKRRNTQGRGEVAVEKITLSCPSESLGGIGGLQQKNEAKPHDISLLMDSIKELPLKERLIITSEVPGMFNGINKASNIGSKRKGKLGDKLELSYGKGRNGLLKGHPLGEEGEKINEVEKGHGAQITSVTPGDTMKKGEGSSSESAVCMVKQSMQVCHPTDTEVIQNPLTAYADGHAKKKAVLRFLRKDVVGSEIQSSLQQFEPVMIKEVFSFKGSHFKDAIIHFKTEEGLKKALRQLDVPMKGSYPFMEASGINAMANKICVPNLIGDPDVPIALVKHPTRTVKIKQLTDDISWHHLKEALAFCRSDITSCFFGSSSSVAYVEFEEEEGKERALEKQSIDVLGKELLIFRVDVPRTTVVRIANLHPKSYVKVSSICTSYGKVRNVRVRTRHPSFMIVDVHYIPAEWPNMLYILNSLNGLEVDGGRWIAEPAPFIPPLILRVLWNHPDERRHVKAMIRRLFKRLQSPMRVDELTDLAMKYYG